MEMETLRDLFLDELKDVYHAEGQLVKALNKMAKTAESDELKAAFQQHLEETKDHQERLTKVFELFDEKPKTKVCKAMQGIVEEGKEVMEEDMEPDVMDAALIASAQRAEHYEIAAYGTLVTWARTMEHDSAADLLQQNLDEEKAADEKLTDIAESGVNEQAAQSTH